MRVLDLALKDLKQVARERTAALFLLIMPILFTLFFGLVFGGSGGEKDPRLPVGFVDRDSGSFASAGLRRLLEGSDTIRPVVLDEKAAARAGERVRDGKLAAVVVVPAGFGERAMAGGDARATLIVDRASSGGQTAASAVQAAVIRLLGAAKVAQLSAEAFAARQPFPSPAGRQLYLQEALTQTVAAWEKPPIAIAARSLQEEKKERPNPFAQASPGMMVQFAIFGLIGAGSVLVMERKSGTLQRLLTTPITRGQVVAGHTLGTFTVVFIQEAILVLVGQLAFGVGYLRQPLATLLVVVPLAAFSTSLGLLIGAVSREEEQVIMWTLIAMFILSAMGGAWFPLDITGQAFSTIGHLLPTAWAMDGFQNVVLRGLGAGSVLLPAGVLLAYTALCFGLAVWRFRFE